MYLTARILVFRILYPGRHHDPSSRQVTWANWSILAAKRWTLPTSAPAQSLRTIRFTGAPRHVQAISETSSPAFRPGMQWHRNVSSDCFSKNEHCMLHWLNSIASAQEHWQNLGYQISTNLPHHSTMLHWFVDYISYSSNRWKSVTTLNRQLNNFPTRSHDFANALWRHRNIDKTFDIKFLQICHITQPHATLVCGLHLLFFKQVKVSHNPQLPTKQFSYSISWFCQCSVASQEHWQNFGYQIPTNLPHKSIMLLLLSELFALLYHPVLHLFHLIPSDGFAVPNPLNSGVAASGRKNCTWNVWKNANGMPKKTTVCFDMLVLALMPEIWHAWQGLTCFAGLTCLTEQSSQFSALFLLCLHLVDTALSDFVFSNFWAL